MEKFCAHCIQLRTKSGILPQIEHQYTIRVDNFMNNLKTFFLLTLLTLIAIGVGNYFGGQNGMILGFAIAAVTNFISYFFSDKIALAMYRAQPVTREHLPRIYSVVEQLTQKAGLPMPKLFVIPTDSPNAF